MLSRLRLAILRTRGAAFMALLYQNGGVLEIPAAALREAPNIEAEIDIYTDEMGNREYRLNYHETHDLRNRP